MNFIDQLLASLKKNGMRKLFYALAGLAAIFILCFARRLTGGEFVAAFATLVGSVMAANGYEHKNEKKKETPDAPPA